MKTMKTMKTKQTASILAAFFALAAGASAQATTWFYGASDNSANFGVTPDSSQAITWNDAWANGDALQNTYGNNNYIGSESLQVSRPDLFGYDQSIMMFGFGGTGLTAADVGNAILHIRQDFSSFPGFPNTWNIVGIAAGNTGWDTNTMTWNDINGGAAGDWTGGTLGGSLFGSYGTFQDLGSNTTPGNIAIDVTSAFQAFLNGTISGIAFVDSTTGTTFAATDLSFIPFSNDNTIATNRPGLLVTAIPEPSTALLGCLGVLALLRRRR